MIHSIYNQRFEVIERAPGRSAPDRADFTALFGDASDPAGSTPEAPAAPNSTSGSTQAASVPSGQSSLGDPDVQLWLNNYYAELSASNPQFANSATIPYQPAPGKGADNYPAGSVYGPQQIYTQALYNQNDGLFSALVGRDPSDSMSQLPGIPTQPAQQAYDRELALENAQRLALGQPIDTAAYWSDPGPLNFDGHTYTSQELGYCGAGQSSSPEPIYISQGNQIPGTNTFSVPGYSGAVTGIQPERYYTLQQLEQAGLKSGQPDAQFHPGSWSTATT
ncbi:MAG TPA: hypothetical protein VKR61_18060 [Bryobacteraceae bacterium]|nr:hypothetical protein [Bryobacteraceae bacterium]